VVPALSPFAEILLVTWTDPVAIGSAVAGLVLIALLVRAFTTQGTGSSAASTSSASSASSTGPQSSTGGQQPRSPPTSPQDLKQRAENADTSLAGEGQSLAEMIESETVDNQELLSRFVRNASGEQVGETMTVTEDEVILKQDGEFLAVDPEAVIEKDGSLLADPNLDWEQARERGENWREANLDRMEYGKDGMPKT
jgi:hypothetical protein